MKAAFHSYYRPPSTELRDMAEHGRIVLDANVLLDFYRYSPAESDALLTVFENFAERMWLPRQFAAEYHESRPAVIATQAEKCRNVKSTLANLLGQQLRNRKQHPFLENGELVAIESVCSRLEELAVQQERLIGADPYLDRLTAMFEHRTGDDYGPEKLAAVHLDAAERYSKKIPPGYLDEKKGPPRCYGDYVAWRQIMDFAKAEQSRIVLVTADAKADWWRIVKDYTIGPRPELLSEFRRETAMNCYILTPAGFLSFAKDEVAVPDGLIGELELRDKERIADDTGMKKWSGGTLKATLPMVTAAFEATGQPLPSVGDKPKSASARAVNEDPSEES